MFIRIRHRVPLFALWGCLGLVLLGGLLLSSVGPIYAHGQVPKQSGALAHPQQPTGQAATLSGTLNIVWGDGAAGSKTNRTLYFITDDNGVTTELRLTPETMHLAGKLLELNGHHIQISGTEMRGAATTGAASVFQLRSIQTASAPDKSFAPTVSGSQPWITIMCKFSDISDEQRDLSYFQNMYGNGYPTLGNYWSQVSFNQINLNGSGAVGWYSLPHPRSYYVPTEDSVNLDTLFDDCTAAADASVNFNNYLGINMMFNANLDCCAWGGGHYTTLDGTTKTWYTTWQPPWGFTNITVTEHEMGHGFGLPHSSGNYGLVYDNRWDVMSDTWTDCGNASDSTYGCMGQDTISYHLDRLGWISSGRKYTASSGSTSITLEQTDQPQTNNYLMAQIPIGGSSTHFYTVEVRRKNGYDVKLPGEGVIIHEVDTTRGEPAHVIDIDNNGNTGDDGAIWLAGETFSDSSNNIAVSIDSATSTGFNVTISNGGGSACAPDVTLLSYPDSVAPSDTVDIQWNVSGSSCVNVSHTNIHWDTFSHLGEGPDAYTYFEDAFSGSLGDYEDTFAAPASGAIYFIIHAIVDDQEISSPELSIGISDGGCAQLNGAPPLTIPDNGQWVERSFTVTDAPANAVLTGIKLKYDIAHPAPEQLQVELVNQASGRTAQVWDHQSQTGARLEASRNDITVFDGLPANGTWTLRVRDTVHGKNGILTGFSVRPEYAYQGPTLHLDSASSAKPLALQFGAAKPHAPQKETKKTHPVTTQPRAPRSPTDWELLDYETFEGTFPEDAWQTYGGTTDGYDVYWDDDSYNPHAGSWAAWAANGGADGLDPAVYCYPNGLDTWMIYGPFDLSNADDAETAFDLWRDVEVSYDYVFFGVSNDFSTFYGYYWDGTADWETEAVDYANFVGSPNVWVGWKFHSDESVTYAGPWIDEVAVWKHTSTVCYTLTTSVSPAASGSVNANPAPDCNNGTLYTAGTIVSLTANANTGYAFSNWSDGATGATNPINITMSADKSVTANFVTSGSVYLDSVWTSKPNGIVKANFKRGQKLRYHARILNTEADTCSSFSKWTSKGNGRTIMKWSGALDIDPGDWDYSILTTIPFSAPDGQYVFKVIFNCNGNATTKKINLTVQGGATTTTTSKSKSPAPERKRQE